MKRVLIVLLLIGLVAGPAMAFDVSDVSDGEENGSLWQIVNALYGPSGAIDTLLATAMTSNADLAGIQFNPDQVFFLGSSTTMQIDFLARFAGHTQQLGYYLPADGTSPNDADMSPLVTIDNDIPNNILVTNLNEDDVETSVLSGSVVGLWPGTPQNLGFYDNSPNDDENVFYSESVLNNNNFDHMVTLLLDEEYDSYSGITTQLFMLAFEDIPGGGDEDYNDVVVSLQVESSTPFKPIPEPASMALLGMGIVGMALRKRFMA